MSVYHMHAWFPQRLEEGVGFPGIGVIIQVLGIKPGSFGRTPNAINHGAISPALDDNIT